MPKSALHFVNAVLVGCFIIAHCVAAVSAQKAGSKPVLACAALGHPSFEITRKPFEARATTMQTVHTKEIDLSFEHVIDIKGEGANCLKGLTGNFVLLRNDDVYELSGYGYLMRREKSHSPYAFSVDQNGPALKGRRPVSVAAFSSSKYDHQRVGVWLYPGESNLVLFDSEADKKSPPHIIGTAKMKLRDVNYFPAPDAPIGTMTVLHDVAPDHVEIFVGQLRDKPFVR